MKNFGSAVKRIFMIAVMLHVHAHLPAGIFFGSMYGSLYLFLLFIRKIIYGFFTKKGEHGYLKLFYVEVNIRRVFRAGIRFIIRLRAKPEYPGKKVVREGLYFQVILVYRFVKILPGNIDPVFRTL